MSGGEPQEDWIGRPVEGLPTPVIVADADAVHANLTRLAEHFNDRPCRLRPHFKSHKCVTLAHRQMMCPNTTGITCAKVSEAEQLVAGGIDDVLIANQVVGTDKAARVAVLNARATVRVAADSTTAVDQLGAAAIRAGVTIGILIEVDIGMNRGGVLPGSAVLRLADHIRRTDGVRFDGLQAYEGHIVTLEDYTDRKRQVTDAMMPLLETRRALEAEGFSLFVSAGGTGTYDITGHMDGIDELQCGSYALMDSFYQRIRPEFENARTLLATITSVRGNTVTADVGLKGMGAEYASPGVVGFPEARVLYVAEEHTVMEGVPLKVGENVRLIPPHGCTTNNLHSRMWVARNNIIEAVWPIEGRGCLE